jgi:hypothetical protein
MTNCYLNRLGVEYYLPDFGPPVRWISCVMLPPNGPDLPALYYFECDAENRGSRAVHIYEDGRVLLAYPGGPDGDHLPEGPLPPVGKTDQTGLEAREITKLEFDALWVALSRLQTGG